VGEGEKELRKATDWAEGKIDWGEFRGGEIEIETFGIEWRGNLEKRFWKFEGLKSSF
jgi:hypothetical protein